MLARAMLSNSDVITFVILGPVFLVGGFSLLRLMSGGLGAGFVSNTLNLHSALCRFIHGVQKRSTFDITRLGK